MLLMSLKMSANIMKMEVPGIVKLIKTLLLSLIQRCLYTENVKNHFAEMKKYGDFYSKTK